MLLAHQSLKYAQCSLFKPQHFKICFALCFQPWRAPFFFGPAFTLNESNFHVSHIFFFFFDSLPEFI